jgi:hypothetical protein
MNRRLLATAAVIFAWAALAVSIRLLGSTPTDARMFRTGAVLCGPDLYKYDRQAAVQTERGTFAPFMRAPFYALALRPLVRFDFRTAWYAVNAAALAALMFLLPAAVGRPKDWHLSLLTVFFLAFWLNLILQQDGAIMTLAVAAGLLLLREDRDALAGAVLALTLQKPTLFLALPLVLLLKRRWRALAGYAAAGAALAAVSIAIIGFGAVHDYLDLVRRYELTPYQMPTARGIAANLGVPALWPVLAVLGAALMIWAIRKRETGAAIAVALAGALFVSPQSYGHDTAILIVPLAYFFQRGGTFLSAMELALLFPPLHFAGALPQPWALVYGLTFGLYFVALALDAPPGWRRLSACRVETPLDAQ